ncbi:MAG: hypothetical protein IT434_08230 [Phycisphaerales bacterium]|nr:hypothetical protein [Phycisphaerales bacterium]
MREFDHPDRQVRDLGVVPVGLLQLDPQSRLTIQQFGSLGGVVLGGDLAVHSQVQQGLEPGFRGQTLPFQVGPKLAIELPAVPGAGLDHLHHPAGGPLIHLQTRKQVQEQPLDPRLGEADSGMTRAAVLGAEVVCVLKKLSVGRTLPLGLSGQAVTAVPAADEASGEDQLGTLVHLAAAQLRLHGVEGDSIHQGLEGAGSPLVAHPHLADDVAIAQQLVKRGAGEPRSVVPVGHTLAGQLLAEPVHRQRLVREELEEALDLWRFDRIVLEDAPAIHAHGAIAVGAA